MDIRFLGAAVSLWLLAMPAAAHDFYVTNRVNTDVVVWVRTMADDGATFKQARHVVGSGQTKTVASSMLGEAWYFAEIEPYSGYYWGAGEGEDWYKVDKRPYAVPFSAWPAEAGVPGKVELSTRNVNGLLSPLWTNMYWGASMDNALAFETEFDSDLTVIREKEYLLLDIKHARDGAQIRRSFLAYRFLDGRLVTSSLIVIPVTEDEYDAILDEVRDSSTLGCEKGDDFTRCSGAWGIADAYDSYCSFVYLAPFAASGPGIDALGETMGRLDAFIGERLAIDPLQ